METRRKFDQEFEEGAVRIGRRPASRFVQVARPESWISTTTRWAAGWGKTVGPAGAVTRC
jgi:hypothetical protein